MKAVVYQGVGDIRLDTVDDPRIEAPTDAVVRITTSAICGTDLHFVRGTVPGMAPGTVLGHEGVGVVEEVGRGVRNVKKGDRVVVPSTIACGTCVYCRAGYHSQCDQANPHGPDAGTAFFGGPRSSGSFDGMQAELVRVPYAHVGLVRLPDEIGDDDAILLSDILPTAYFAARLAEIAPGDVVAVFGAGPVGQLAIACALALGAGRVLAVDRVASRLETARGQGAEIIDFEAEDPIESIKELTDGIGVDRAIDAVGVGAVCAHHGPAAQKARAQKRAFEEEVHAIAPEARAADERQWAPGDAPSQALRWTVQAVAKAGTIAIVGVYPETAERFPIGRAMEKNLTLKMGNCNHRRYIPELVARVRTGALTPSSVLSQRASFGSAIEAYEAFDRREPGWTKVELRPAAA